MWNLYRNFIRGIAVNWTGRAGIILTTSSFLIFMFLETASLTGVLTNVYMGIITYLILPFIFIIGLILILLAWLAYVKKEGKSTRELLTRRFSDNMTDGKKYWSHVFTVIGLFTIVNIIFLAAASMGALHFMDRPSFCGTACHKVMNPEWVTYQQSPHARVKCVECHVGEGFKSLLDSKINGAWQVISLFFNLYERPIPTPVHNLRPAQHTCEKCHWPEKFYGGRIKTVARYQTDKDSSPLYTTLKLKIDQGTKVGESGIHWHVSRHTKVNYISKDDLRREMILVTVTYPDGSFKEYKNHDLAGHAVEKETIRTMDCMDCHNRATHIYENPSHAIDERISRGLLDPSLPYLKATLLDAIEKRYPDILSARTGITNHIHFFYEKQLGLLYTQQLPIIEKAVLTALDIFERNIHPNMNIQWNSYPNHIGHERNEGCFRCHNLQLKAAGTGERIPHDCTACHSMLAFQSDRPFQFLEPANQSDREKPLHEYLRKEFLGSKH
ncbi:MAG: NapC/NirT family cytochrome c [Candidatus Aminicenantes bacterium]|nr:NapC/NirT family cytochrome c [Candidatus Aminicenantes bacterium]